MYRPKNYESCCPLLSIRLKVEDFVWDKPWRRVGRRLDRVLATGRIQGEEEEEDRGGGGRERIRGRGGEEGEGQEEGRRG